MFDWLHVILLTLGGVGAGILAGLFGVGGGVVIVPVLFYIFYHQGFSVAQAMPVAVATSLATMLITSPLSAWSHHHKGSVDWLFIRRIATAICLGGASGVLAVQWLVSGQALKSTFALFLIYIAITLIRQTVPKPHRKRALSIPVHATAWIIGTFSAMLGVGGGTMTVPWLSTLQYPMHKAVGTAAFIGLLISLPATIMFAITGSHPDHTAYFLGSIHIPAFVLLGMGSIAGTPAGARLAYRIGQRRLKQGFALLLIIVGVHLFFS